MPVAHLGFAFKHEGVHPELLSHAVAKLDKQSLAEWVATCTKIGVHFR